MLAAHSLLFMVTPPKRKYSGCKIALHSDLWARARLGDAVVAVTERTRCSSVLEILAISDGRASRRAAMPSENALNDSNSSS